jgi:hypothetical protein
MRLFNHRRKLCLLLVSFMTQADERDRRGRKNQDVAQRLESAGRRGEVGNRQRSISDEVQASDTSGSSLLTKENRKDERLAALRSSAEDEAEDHELLWETKDDDAEDANLRSLNYSDTDEDEDEGLGDGNLGHDV